MLRLAPQGPGEVSATPQLVARRSRRRRLNVSGGGAGTARDRPTVYVTALPETRSRTHCEGELRRLDGTRRGRKREGRLGIYYSEGRGGGRREISGRSKVVYDRDGRRSTLRSPADIVGSEVFAERRVVPITGITTAISARRRKASMGSNQEGARDG